MASARQPLNPAVSLTKPDPFASGLRRSLECPACGRKSAVVFPDMRVSQSLADALLVCLACCRSTTDLTPPDDAGITKSKDGRSEGDREEREVATADQGG